MEQKKVHLIRQGKNYYSEMFDDKNYMCVFFHRYQAARYTRFLHNYKNKTGKFPYIGQKTRVLKEIKQSNEEIVVHTEYLESFRHECLLHGVNLFGISEVETESFDSITISGIDLTENYSVPEDDLIESLNTLLFSS